jgi:hypothetical protein
MEMATANSTISAEISDIQRRMAQVRHEMHQEVQGAVKGAQALTDWRALVRSHPWLSLGVAAAAGYLLVPGRRWETPAVVALGTPVEVAPAARDQPAPARRAGWSTMGTVFDLLAPIAVRAAQNFALQRLEQWLKVNPLHPAESARARQSESGVAQAVRTGPSAGFRDSRS